MSKLIRSVFKPITVPVAMCRGRVAAMDEPLKRHIDACEAKGEDVCAHVWREYVGWQQALLPHRMMKLRAEAQYVLSGEIAIATATVTDFLHFAKFATTCLTIFLVFVMLGRGSVFPPLAPESPFVDEVLANWQVNHINNLTAGSGIRFLQTNVVEPVIEEDHHEGH